MPPTPTNFSQLAGTFTNLIHAALPVIFGLAVLVFVWGLVKERISKEDYDRTQIYILIYSFISANMYLTNDPTDGHFTWCINNLNNSKFLKFL